MTFKITLHSGFSAPADALDTLWVCLAGDHDEVRFEKVGTEIRATVGEDAPISMDREERGHIGRRAVLDIVREVCDRAPELCSDWFAVSAVRH